MQSSAAWLLLQEPAPRQVAAAAWRRNKALSQAGETARHGNRLQDRSSQAGFKQRAVVRQSSLSRTVQQALDGRAQATHF